MFVFLCISGKIATYISLFLYVCITVQTKLHHIFCNSQTKLHNMFCISEKLQYIFVYFCISLTKFQHIFLYLYMFIFLCISHKVSTYFLYISENVATYIFVFLYISNKIATYISLFVYVCISVYLRQSCNMCFWQKLSVLICS